MLLLLNAAIHNCVLHLSNMYSKYNQCPSFVLEQLFFPSWVLFLRSWILHFSLLRSLISFTLHCRRSRLVESKASKRYACLCMCVYIHYVYSVIKNIIKAIILSSFRVEWISFSWWLTPRKPMIPVKWKRTRVTHTATYSTHIKARLKTNLNNISLLSPQV